MGAGIITNYFERKARVKLPKCEHCEMEAQYDFVDDQGEWRYGCVTHWMKYRASKQIGPGHARHLTPGEHPPKRPEGYVAKPIDPTRLVKPRTAPSTQVGYLGGTATSAATASSGEKAPPREKKPKAERVKAPKEFVDMEPGQEVKELRPGSVGHTTLELIKTNGGATMEEIQAAIGPKHDALKLLQFLHENRGYGWKKDSSGKIQVVYYGGG